MFYVLFLEVLSYFMALINKAKFQLKKLFVFLSFVSHISHPLVVISQFRAINSHYKKVQLLFIYRNILQNRLTFKSF